MMATVSVRFDAARGLDWKPLAVISPANADDNALIRIFTRAYSSAYARVGPFLIRAMMWGFIGMGQVIA